MNLLVTLLLLIAIYLLVVLWITYQCSTNLEHYTFAASTPGPKVLIVAGTHGNEPAGTEALKAFVTQLQQGSLKLTKGSVTVLPSLNPCGRKLGLRYQPQQLLKFHAVDLNRSYPSQQGEEGSCEVSNQVAKLVEAHDFVWDMHEAWGFNQIHQDSMGTCVFPSKTLLAEDIAQHVVDVFNSSLSSQSDRRHVWQNKVNYQDTKGTLRYYCDQLKKPYILVETTGQNDIQSMAVRQQQHLTMLLNGLNALGLL